MSNAAVTDASAAPATGAGQSSWPGWARLRQPSGHHHPLCLAAALLPRPLPHRLQDLAVADGDRHAALHAGASIFSGGFSGYRRQLKQLHLRQLRLADQDALYFRAYLSTSIIAGDLDVPDAARRLPDRLRHGARAAQRWRPTLLMLVILPFWTSFLIRVYAWIGILKTRACSTSCCSGSASSTSR